MQSWSRAWKVGGSHAIGSCHSPKRKLWNQLNTIKSEEEKWRGWRSVAKDTYAYRLPSLFVRKRMLKSETHERKEILNQLQRTMSCVELSFKESVLRERCRKVRRMKHFLTNDETNFNWFDEKERAEWRKGYGDNRHRLPIQNNWTKDRLDTWVILVLYVEN